jgi:hypothetical protein
MRSCSSALSQRTGERYGGEQFNPAGWSKCPIGVDEPTGHPYRFRGRRRIAGGRFIDDDRALLVLGRFSSQMDAMQALALSDAPKSWAVVRPK